MLYDLIIIGGGIVGLASCLQVLEQRPGSRILVLEKERDIALHQTGHNSGVIHSGIYYHPGSAKSTTCRQGYYLLLDWCQRYQISYKICGKIIVAANKSELPFLDTLMLLGKKNGLQGIRMISAEEIQEFEPHATGIGGIHVPHTGIVNFAQVAHSMKSVAEQTGVEFQLGEKVVGLGKISGGVELLTLNNSYRSRQVVSCCGLQSDRVASLSMTNLAVRIVPFRGEYYKLKEEYKNLVRNLIYPVPDPDFPFLGVHFTRTIDGAVEAGPNAVLAFKREGYQKYSFSVHDFYETMVWPGFHKIAAMYWRVGLAEFQRSYSKKSFVYALQRLIPEISEDSLEPGGAGVRAQACSKKGQLLDDFLFVEEERILHVCNAPSPAATASLAIGRQIAAKVADKL